jgi:FAD/FMN-containing dehydrogenase
VITSNKTPAFDVFTQSYWSSQQSDLDPACVFKPRTAEDVSIMILVSRVTLCPFAVKSGGHSQFAGASSIENGIAVSFEHMKEVSLASDKRTAAIGPGNDWYEAYSALEEYKVTVIGARVSSLFIHRRHTIEHDRCNK